MPLIASAKKRMRQNAVRRVRNAAEKSRMRTLCKNLLKWAAEGATQKATDFWSAAQKSIDTCVKKNLVHRNTGARKKAHLARALAKAGITGGPQKLGTAAKSAAKPAAKKAAAKKTSKTTAPKTSG